MLLYMSHFSGSNDDQGRFSVIKDCVRIEDGTVIPPNTVIAPFSVYSGEPGKYYKIFYGG